MFQQQHDTLVHTVEARDFLAAKAVKLEQALIIAKVDANNALVWRDEARKLRAQWACRAPFPPAPAPVKGYEPYTPEFVEAIRSTTMTHADRQNKTQDEVFKDALAGGAGVMRVGPGPSFERIAPSDFVDTEPPPAKEDAQ